MHLFETMESRTLLSAGISASLTHGALLIRGDDQPNSIIISADPHKAGRLTVKGDTPINGKSPLATFDNVQTMRIALGAGVNSLTLTDLHLRGNLSILGGRDADQIAVNPAAVGGDLTIVTGGGDDTVNLMNTTVTGRTDIRTGNGKDLLTADASTFAKKLIVSTGQDDDSVYLGNSRFPAGKSVNDGGGSDLLTTHPIAKHFDFSNGAQGWTAGFADYAKTQEDDLHLDSGIRRLPPELGSATGYLISGKNIADDLFMYLTRELTAADGITPGQSYQVRYTIRFASNAPTGAYGVGGAPGESVWLKAGASATAPASVLDANDFYKLNVDHNNQSAGGTAASLVGNIASGRTQLDGQYVSLVREHIHTAIVQADPQGSLHLLVGTDSGYESTTALYYQRIDVKLIPVTQPSQEKTPDSGKGGGGGDVHPV